MQLTIILLSVALVGCLVVITWLVREYQRGWRAISGIRKRAEEAEAKYAACEQSLDAERSRHHDACRSYENRLGAARTELAQSEALREQYTENFKDTTRKYKEGQVEAHQSIVSAEADLTNETERADSYKRRWRETEKRLSEIGTITHTPSETATLKGEEATAETPPDVPNEPCNFLGCPEEVQAPAKYCDLHQRTMDEIGAHCEAQREAAAEAEAPTEAIICNSLGCTKESLPDTHYCAEHNDDDFLDTYDTKSEEEQEFSSLLKDAALEIVAKRDREAGDCRAANCREMARRGDEFCEKCRAYVTKHGSIIVKGRIGDKNDRLYRVDGVGPEILPDSGEAQVVPDGGGPETTGRLVAPGDA